VAVCFFFFQAEDGIRDFHVTGVQTCALPIWLQRGVLPRPVADARAAGGVPPQHRDGSCGRGPVPRVYQEWIARREHVRRPRRERRRRDKEVSGMTGEATERVLAALERNGATIKQVPHGWLATCPVPSHEDRNPSFSVQEGNGLVLYRCRSGCPQEVVTDALYALGLKAEDLYDDRRGVTYTYRDKPGGRKMRTVRRYTRNGDKTFSQEGPQARLGKGAALYRPDDFDLESALSGDVWIAEGEKDADTLWRHGVAAVSAAGGAGAWSKFDYSTVAKAANVVIVADNDSAGLQRAYGLYRHLVEGYGANARVVLPKAGNDATD